MNQCIKDCVYNRGTRHHVDFMADISGMNDEERKMLHLLHDGQTDLYIMEEMSLCKKSFSRIEESVRAKLLLAVFDCINYTMDNK